MSRRYAMRRDDNEPEVVPFARNLGWELWKLDTPCDWLGLRRGVWYPIEIKDPAKRGHADEFTPAQRLFMSRAFACGGRLLVWYTQDDVLRDSNARVSA